MRKRLLVGALIAVVVAMFLFVPWIQTTTANFGGGPDYVGWVSTSFALFQCGVATGSYGVQVPNGLVVIADKPKPLWSSFWNCDYPRL